MLLGINRRLVETGGWLDSVEYDNEFIRWFKFAAVQLF